MKLSEYKQNNVIRIYNKGDFNSVRDIFEKNGYTLDTEWSNSEREPNVMGISNAIDKTYLYCCIDEDELKQYDIIEPSDFLTNNKTD